LDAVRLYFPNRTFLLVFGISEDKELTGMIREIAPLTAYVITTRADHPRAMDADRLFTRFKAAGVDGEAIPDVGTAFRKALNRAGDQDMILVTGSIFVAASARIAWQEMTGEKR
jgi:dihydrofolate synthase/folylpolyglutamate synthase